jgi:adenylosuccinate synthase
MERGKIHIIVGGQFGSEGKGKVANFFTNLWNIKHVVRIGGPNSGHSVYDEEGKNKFIFRQIPSASVLNRHINLYLGAGSYIDKEVLEKDLKIIRDLFYNNYTNRIIIDNNASLIFDYMRENEKHNINLNSISSTFCGVGEAIKRRIERIENDIILFKNNRNFDSYNINIGIGDTKNLLNMALENGEDILIEGTQGYGLSLLHSNDYPFVTSRDTTAAGFLSEVGLSPIDIGHIIMVIRSFPIRVAGCSGPLPEEITWETLSREINKEVCEYTSVTNKVRRIGRFDEQVVKEAIIANNPDIIVLNFADYLNRDFNKINQIEDKIGRVINFLGFDDKTIVPIRYIKF